MLFQTARAALGPALYGLALLVPSMRPSALVIGLCVPLCLIAMDDFGTRLITESDEIGIALIAAWTCYLHPTGLLFALGALVMLVLVAAITGMDRRTTTLGIADIIVITLFAAIFRERLVAIICAGWLLGCGIELLIRLGQGERSIPYLTYLAPIALVVAAF